MSGIWQAFVSYAICHIMLYYVNLCHIIFNSLLTPQNIAEPSINSWPNFGWTKDNKSLPEICELSSDGLRRSWLSGPSWAVAWYSLHLKLAGQALQRTKVGSNLGKRIGSDEARWNSNHMTSFCLEILLMFWKIIMAHGIQKSGDGKAVLNGFGFEISKAIQYLFKCRLWHPPFCNLRTMAGWLNGFDTARSFSVSLLAFKSFCQLYGAVLFLKWPNWAPGVVYNARLVLGTLFVRFVAVILFNTTGYPCGREGPTVTQGSGLAFLFCRCHWDQIRTCQMTSELKRYC